MNNFLINLQHHAGFTLAEVLITLGVIGVVAAMTLPTLIQNTQNQALKPQLKKGMSVVESAFKQAAVDNGGSLAGYSSRSGDTLVRGDDLINFMQPYFSDAKKCYYANRFTCSPITTPYKTYSGGAYPADWSQAATRLPLIILKDGSIVYFSAYYESWQNCDGNQCGIITMDTNGIKAPNQAGYDVFEFWITPTGALIPLGTMNDPFKNSYSKDIGYDKILDMLN